MRTTDVAAIKERTIAVAIYGQDISATDEWYTPPHVFVALACQFDLDVASPGPEKTPWIPALGFYTQRSLEKKWYGFVWMNAPFGARNGLVPWLEKFFNHGDGIALVPDRTSAPWWQTFVPQADLVLFVTPKIKFVSASGELGRSPADGTCLLAKGFKGRIALKRAAQTLGALFSPLGVSSAVERLAVNEQVGGSNPLPPANSWKCTNCGEYHSITRSACPLSPRSTLRGVMGQC